MGFPLLQVLMITQIWRFFSEMLRDDYRGEGKISAYQFMMIAAILYTALVPMVFPHGRGLEACLAAGWRAIWSPGVILSVQALWAALFVHYGKSTVTGGAISFHVVKDRI